MIARATTTISILRGSTKDAWNDDAPSNTKVAQGVPASIIEQTRRVFTYDDPTPRIVRYFIGRVDHAVDIKSNDTVLDEVTGVTYLVDSFSVPANPVIAVDKKLDLRITN